MKMLGRRIRGAIGMGLTWAVAWVGAGVLLACVLGVDSDIPLGLLFAPLGFVSGIVFSALLVRFTGDRRFDRMSLTRFAALGAASGLVLSGLIVVGALFRGQSVWVEVALFAPVLAAARRVFVRTCRHQCAQRRFRTNVLAISIATSTIGGSPPVDAFPVIAMTTCASGTNTSAASAPMPLPPW